MTAASATGRGPAGVIGSTDPPREAPLGHFADVGPAYSLGVPAGIEANR